MIAILDSDLIVYRAGFASEKNVYIITDARDGSEHIFSTKTLAAKWISEQPEGTELNLEYKTEIAPPEHCLQNVNTLVRMIKDRVDCPCELYLTGKNNFRTNIATIQPYKGNRSAFAKPRHYDLIREHLQNRYNAKVIDGWEADDEVAIRANEIGTDKAIIVSNDKDLDMVPGIHYNWVKDIKYEIDERKGNYNFATQMLVGDTVDNIPGIDGVGPKTAAKLLAGCTKLASLWGSVYRAYFDHYGVRYDKDHTLDDALLEIARLLWIKRSRDEPLWTFPS